MVERMRTQVAELEGVQIDAGAIVLFLVSVVPFVLGWLVGVLVRAAVWLIAALVAGYKAGRGSG